MAPGATRVGQPRLGQAPRCVQGAIVGSRRRGCPVPAVVFPCPRAGGVVAGVFRRARIRIGLAVVQRGVGRKGDCEEHRCEHEPGESLADRRVDHRVCLPLPAFHWPYSLSQVDTQCAPCVARQETAADPEFTLATTDRERRQVPLAGHRQPLVHVRRRATATGTPWRSSRTDQSDASAAQPCRPSAPGPSAGPATHEAPPLRGATAPPVDGNSRYAAPARSARATRPLPPPPSRNCPAS